jgi:hypothetical protein
MYTNWVTSTIELQVVSLSFLAFNHFTNIFSTFIDVRPPTASLLAHPRLSTLIGFL